MYGHRGGGGNAVKIHYFENLLELLETYFVKTCR